MYVRSGGRPCISVSGALWWRSGRLVSSRGQTVNLSWCVGVLAVGLFADDNIISKYYGNQYASDCGGLVYVVRIACRQPCW